LSIRSERVIRKTVRRAVGDKRPNDNVVLSRWRSRIDTELNEHFCKLRICWLHAAGTVKRKELNKQP